MEAVTEEEGPESGEVRVFWVEQEAAGQRLDVYLATRLEPSRSRIQDWIREGRVLLNGGFARFASRVRPGQEVLVEIPPPEPARPEPDESIPLDVLYEDPDLLVLNKQRGLTIHPGSNQRKGTLVNALLARCQDLSGIRGVQRPGIVHRLDKYTSGVMVVAKSDRAHLGLAAQFRERTVLKEYEALVHGVPAPRKGRIDRPIGRHRVVRHKMAVRGGGRRACTDYRVAETFGERASRLILRLHTGRTHQIRVHMGWLGHPLIGDPLYGRRDDPFGLEGQALHCRRLGFLHPVRGQHMEFTAPCPPEYTELLERLRRGTPP